MDSEKKPVTPGELLRASSKPSDGEDIHGNEPQVYNVMPKLNGKGPITPPSLQVSDTSAENNRIDGLSSQDQPAFTAAKYLKLLVVLLALFGIAFAGYRFGPEYYKKYFGNSPENPALNPDQQSQPQNPGQAQQNTLPAEWLKKFFGEESCTRANECGTEADPDMDGLLNIEEFQLATEPNSPDSDSDGIADGDEVHVFQSNPLKQYTLDDPNYSDADHFKGGYDNSNRLRTEAELLEIKNRMGEKGLHLPTIATLGDSLKKIYNFGADPGLAAPVATSTPATTTEDALAGFEMTAEAMQDRDAQRTTTIKNIGIGLVKYFETNKAYPNTSDFMEMYESVKVFMKVATNPKDPVNKEPYIYSYTVSESAQDFTLSFYSEIVRQPIRKKAADAQKDKVTQEAEVFDELRTNDLKRLQTALLLYSSKQSGGTQTDVFPSEQKYKTELLASGDISEIPKDPKTQGDYEYKVSESFDTFTLKALLDNPPSGSTGYLCNQLECDYY